MKKKIKKAKVYKKKSSKAELPGEIDWGCLDYEKVNPAHWSAYLIFTVLILYIGTIIYFATLPATEITNPVITMNSALLHFLEFFVLTILLLTCVVLTFDWFDIRVAHIIAFTLAAGTELAQLFVPGRVAAWSDFFINISGIIVAWIFLIILLGILIVKGVGEYEQEYESWD